MLNDLRYALRMLLKNPGFTTVAVLTLALGIGANTAIFSVINGVLLKPLAYRDRERIVTILQQGMYPVAAADFLDWRAQNQSFETLAAAEAWGGTLMSGDEPETIPGIRFGEGMFETLGVQPLIGRTFQVDDFKSGNQALVLGYSLWQRRFGGDPSIVGRSITLNGESHTIIGVMPQQFRFTPFWATKSEMAAPLDLTARVTERGGNSLRIFARLKPGILLAQAQAEMNAICVRLEEAYPDTNTGRTVQVDPLLEKVVGNIRLALQLLVGAVVFVLLIACANVANLLLVRAAARQKEMAIRTALGASRWRTIRQLLTESVVLAIIAGVLGLVLGYGSVEWIKGLLAGDSSSFRVRMPRVTEITVDSTTLLFTLGIALMTGLVFGLAPALQAARPDLQDALKESGRGTTETRRGRRMRCALVVAEIALALIMVVGAGLMLRSFTRLAAVKPGFDPHNLISMIVSLYGQPDMVGEKREVFYRQLIEKIRLLPEVESVSAINHFPLAGDIWGWEVNIEGRPLPRPGEGIGAVYRVVRPAYFQTMSISLLRGRDFTLQDNAKAPGVAIINERFVRQHWPDEDPIGKRLTLIDANKNPYWRTIVGITANARQNSWSDDPDNEIYVPFLQSDFATNTEGHVSAMTLVVRTAANPRNLVGVMRDAVRSLNRGAAVSSVTTMEEVIANAVWAPRFNLILIGLFAGLALLLGAVGIYGVVAYAVTQRTHEIGIRMALGAKRHDALTLILAQGIRLVITGVILGLAAALGLTRLMSSLLYGVSANDPMTFAAVVVILTGVALMACYIPARRATKVDPMVALRHE
jgi:predicted permease